MSVVVFSLVLLHLVSTPRGHKTNLYWYRECASQLFDDLGGVDKNDKFFSRITDHLLQGVGSTTSLDQVEVSIDLGKQKRRSGPMLDFKD